MSEDVDYRLECGMEESITAFVFLKNPNVKN